MKRFDKKFAKYLIEKIKKHSLNFLYQPTKADLVAFVLHSMQ